MAPDYRGNKYQELLREGVSDRGVDVVPGPPAIPFSPILLWVLVRRVDVLHLHWLHPFFLFGGYERLYAIPGSRLVCRLAAVVFVLQVRLATRVCDRIVWTVHNKHNHERWYLSLDRWVTGEVAATADSIQVWDQNTRTELAAYLDVDGESFVEIPHGNYCPVYGGDGPDRTAARRELAVESFDRVYLYFGRIRPYKRIPELVTQFLAIDAEDACLLVAGKPSRATLADRIRTAAADDPRVRLHLSYVPDEDVPTYFAACDAAIFPYEDIFNSGSVLLSMSLGRPFAAPRAGSIPSVAPDGNVLYDDLGQAIRTLHATPADELERTGTRNRQVATREFDWDDVASRIVELYGSAAKTDG